MRVRFDLIRGRQLREPGEANAVFLHLDADIVHTQRLSDEAALCFKQSCKVADVHLVKGDLDRQPCAAVFRSVCGFIVESFVRLTLEACRGNGLDKPFHLFGVVSVAEGQRSVSVDGVGVDLVSHARHSEILCFDLKGLCDGPDQSLALRSRYVVPDFHAGKPPCFLVVHISL